MRELKEYEIICLDCGIPFIAHSTQALRCPECKAKHKRAMSRVGYRPLSKAAKMSIKEVLKALKKYNQEHGTRYEYGEFVSLMERGVIDVGEQG